MRKIKSSTVRAILTISLASITFAQGEDTPPSRNYSNLEVFVSHLEKVIRDYSYRAAGIDPAAPNKGENQLINLEVIPLIPPSIFEKVGAKDSTKEYFSKFLASPSSRNAAISQRTIWASIAGIRGYDEELAKKLTSHLIEKAGLNVEKQKKLISTLKSQGSKSSSADEPNAANRLEEAESKLKLAEELKEKLEEILEAFYYG